MAIPGEADSAIPGEADSVKEDEEVIVDVDDPVFIYSSVGSEGELAVCCLPRIAVRKFLR